MKRGEVWSAATGSGFGGEPRPVVIVQSDALRTPPDRIVALCETARDEPDDVRPRVVPDGANGLEAVSDIAVDLLVTVPIRKFGMPIGRLSAADMKRIENTLTIILGVA